MLHLLGLKTGRALEDLVPEVIRARTIEALRHMLLAASRRRPLLVLFEDLHWIDPASEGYLTTLIENMEDASILLVATHRPDWQRPWTSDECTTEIVLAPLGEDESRALIEAVADRTRLPPSLVRAILEKAEGNPLFLGEVARSVVEQGDAADTLTVPDSLRAVLGARIDRLVDAHKRLLQTAAVLGREFSQRLLEAVWNGPGAVAGHLAELARLDFVHERSAGDDPVYAFNHALIQEVAYEQLLTGTREALHEAAARSLEAQDAGRVERASEQLAYHWTRTPRADKAVESLRRVATRAMANYANAEALAALREADKHADRLESNRERVLLELLIERSQTRFLLGQVPAGLEELRAHADLVARVGDPSLTAQYHVRLASALGVLGDGGGAREHAERALAEAETAADIDTAGRAHYIIGRESFWSGDFSRGIDHGRQAIVLLERAGDRWWLAMAHWSRALNFLLLGRFDDALDSATWASTIASKLERSPAGQPGGVDERLRVRDARGLGDRDRGGSARGGAGARRDEPGAGRGIPRDQLHREGGRGGGVAAPDLRRGDLRPAEVASAGGLVRDAAGPGAADARRSGRSDGPAGARDRDRAQHHVRAGPDPGPHAAGEAGKGPRMISRRPSVSSPARWPWPTPVAPCSWAERSTWRWPRRRTAAAIRKPRRPTSRTRTPHSSS